MLQTNPIANRQSGKWIVQVCGRASNSSSYAGTYGSELEAARAYDRIAKAEFGEFAALNFPSQGGASR